jgi:glutamate racemase
MKTDANQPIGVFDSGVGGLTVLKHLIQEMPDEQFVYLGDTARVPYGNKSKQTIEHYTIQCIDFLLGFNVKAIVIACNTASALALEIAQKHSPIPIIGMIEPAAHYAIESSPSGNIGIIGTRATIHSQAYEKAIQTYADTIHKEAHISSIACPLFVPIVEEDWVNHPAAILIAQEYLSPLISKNIDTLVLGCTHYPLLKELITNILPDITLIDCGYTASKIMTKMLGLHSNQDSSSISKRIQLFTTDTVHSFNVIAERCLGFTLQDPINITTEVLEHHPLEYAKQSAAIKY